MPVQIGDTWKVFTCPECGEELFVIAVNQLDEHLRVISSDIELGCVNGHAWSVGTAFGE